MNEILTGKRPGKGPYKIVREELTGNDAYLTSFFFKLGANFYVFSYQSNGVTKHTFIDAGDCRYYEKHILSILTENDIDPANIERIVITHRHPDHCSLADRLAQVSKAKILVHSNFKNLVDGNVAEQEKGWWGDVQIARFKEHDIVYLLQSDGEKVRTIAGVDFPVVRETINIGKAGKLEVLACPENKQTHSPDQLIALYSARHAPYSAEKEEEGFLPTDDLIFTGDFWLMTGPRFNRGMRSLYRHLRFTFHRIKELLSGKGNSRGNPREQDAPAREALKGGFCLIRVKPGHGEEFIGTRLIPEGLLADSDLLMKLGYPSRTDKSVLEQASLAPRIAAIKEQAYTAFTEELLFWQELGYSFEDISDLVLRIYREQTGGDAQAKLDRKQRREQIKATLLKLSNDTTKPEQLRKLAETTLAKLGTAR
ncbi:MAG: MBL fold metallo-hydrolase [Dehalococcoidales bacterium]|nr:MBL fold metallo-hydrolase [Dehalococcoidales bacterium]